MYEYTFKFISVSSISGQIASQLTKIANKKAKNDWRLINVFVQYVTSGSAHFIYLVFERKRRTRIFKKREIK